MPKMPTKKKQKATDTFLASLDELSEGCGEAEPWRAQAIATLYGCHYIEPKTPFLGITAMVRAGQIGIPAPIWAVKLVDEAINDYIRRGSSLDIAFGFKGEGTGKTRGAEARQRLRKVMLESLCSSVHKLVVGGLSKTKACKQVAQQVKALGRLQHNSNTTLWYNNSYNIQTPNADTLLDHYRTWEQIEKAVSGQKDIEDFKGLTNGFINLVQHYLANPSQPRNEDTVRAMKNFVESLQPQSPSSHK